MERVFGESCVEVCIVDEIGNCMKYVGSKDEKEFMKDLRRVYGGVKKEWGGGNLEVLECKWGEM